MKNVRHVNEIFLITVGIAVVAMFVFGSIPIVQDKPFINLLLSQVIFVIPVIVYLVIGTDNVKDLLRINKVSIPNVILLIVFAFFISPLLSFLNAFSLLFTTNQITDTISKTVYSYPLAISLLLVAVIPAILEETVYRGVFFNEFRKINPRKGVVLSGLLFGLMHMNFNQFIYAFVMGMIFALLVEVTDSIISSMIVHFTINGSSVILMYLLPKIQNLTNGVAKENELVSQTFNATQISNKVLLPVIAFYGVLAVFSTIVAFFILKGIASIAKRPNALKDLITKKSKSKMELLDSLPLMFGIMICFAIMIYKQYFF